MKGVDQLPSGAWRWRVKVQGKMLSRTAATREEAEKMRAAVLHAGIAKDARPLTEPTPFELGPRFLKSRESMRSAKDDSSRWNLHVANARWARSPLSSITRADGLTWLQSLNETQTSLPSKAVKRRPKRVGEVLSWQTQKHLLNLARSFFTWCMDQALLTQNPFGSLRVKREDGDEETGFQSNWWLDANEQTKLLSLFDDFDDTRRREKWIVAFAFGTGLRMGEQWCLHLEDVHLEGDEPHVVVKYGSFDAKREKYVGPKGRRGVKRQRIVPLWGIGLAAARAWLDQLETYAVKNPHGLMFPTERGLRRPRGVPPRSWPEVVRKFGVSPRIGRELWWHLLRHTCASSLVSGAWGMRWSLEDVARVLGHTDVRTTQIYAHLAPKAILSTAKSAGASYDPSCHAGVTPSKLIRVSTENHGRARQDSDLRHSASKATQNRGFVGKSGGRDTVVTTIVCILRDIADGRYVARAGTSQVLCELLERELAGTSEPVAVGVAS